MGAYIVAIDTETTTDAAQQLKFGFFRYCYVHSDYRISLIAEGLFYADNLPTVDPNGFAILREYALSAGVDTDLSFTDREPQQQMEFLSRDQFVNKWLWGVGYKQEAIIVGFNLPFDLSRIAVAVSAARKSYRGGFSYSLWRFPDGTINTYRPRLQIKILDSKKSFIRFTATNQTGMIFPGRFIDLRTLAFALTNAGHSLRSACDTFGVTHAKLTTTEHGSITPSYCDYGRRDVEATVELYGALLREFERHPLELDATGAYSPASLAKAYFTSMGIPRPLDRGTVPQHIVGYAMSSFYGARAESKIRRVPVPVALCDFTSMYPSVNTLLKMWDLLTAEHLYAQQRTDQVEWLLDSIHIDDCFNPRNWPLFRGIAKIRPSGDVLPVRSRYGGGAWNIGVNVLESDDALWYAIPDLVASKLLTGRVPVVEEAWIFEGTGRSGGLRPIQLSGDVWCDPVRDDFFQLIVDKRATCKGTTTGDFLKVLANSGCYGIFAELNKRDYIDPVEINIYGIDDTWTIPGRETEAPGPYCFPPISTVITSAARLMLAMLESLVTDLGGTWALTDTDSMAIVAHDSLTQVSDIPVLKSGTVDRVIATFDRLNPYKHVPHLLKREYDGWCYSISAKRYALYHVESKRVVIDKASHHGLGHLANPTDTNSRDRQWIDQVWRYIVESDLRFDSDRPAWFDRPAITRFSVSQPYVLNGFDVYNHGQAYCHAVKPSNFILVAHAHRLQARRIGKCLPIAPYEPDGNKWLDMDWTNKHNPRESFHIAAHSDEIFDLSPDVVYVQSYADVVREYTQHPEAKFNQMDGRPCQPDYRGQLYRKTIRSLGVTYVSKESNQLELVQHGLLSSTEAVRTRRYTDEWPHLFSMIRPMFEGRSVTELAREIGVNRTSLQHIMAGRLPSPVNRARLLTWAVAVARRDLDTQSGDSDDPMQVLTRWTDSVDVARLPLVE